MRTHISLSARVIPFLMLGLIGLLGASCNSYRPVADNDGIYQSNTRVVEVETEEDKNNYYKQYFSTKAAQMEEIPEEDLIFTDIEAYSTTESLDNEGYIVVEESYDDAYGGWGMNGGDVTVNIYDNGWYGAGWGGGAWLGGWYGPGWGGGWYGPGWYRPWGHWGWGSFWWRNPIGWGGYWGWGANGGWGNPYWNAWHNPYIFPYGSHYGIAGLNRGRSNLDYINGRSSYNRGRSNVNGTRRSYSRSETVRRRANSATRTSRYYNRSRLNTNRVYSRPNNTSRNRNYNSRSNNIQRRNSRPSNSRPSYSRPSSRPSSGSFNRGGSSRGGGRSSGRGGRG